MIKAVVATLVLALSPLAAGAAEPYPGKLDGIQRKLVDSLADAAAASHDCGMTYPAGLRKQLVTFFDRYGGPGGTERALRRFDDGVAKARGGRCDRGGQRAALASAQDYYNHAAQEFAEATGIPAR